MINHLHEAIYQLYPEIVSIIDDTGYDKDGNKVEYDIEKVKKFFDSFEYQRERAAEYPSFADQFDLLYHGGYDVWKAEIDKIKNKYPK